MRKHRRQIYVNNILKSGGGHTSTPQIRPPTSPPSGGLVTHRGDRWMLPPCYYSIVYYRVLLLQYHITRLNEHTPEIRTAYRL